MYMKYVSHFKIVCFVGSSFFGAAEIQVRIILDLTTSWFRNFHLSTSGGDLIPVTAPWTASFNRDHLGSHGGTNFLEKSWQGVC